MAMTTMSMTYAWCVILAAMLIVEFATTALTTIWFAGGALAALILSVLHVSFGVQVVVFIAVSVALLILTRPFAKRFVNKDLTLTNADALVGLDGVVTGEIDNIRGTGSVQVRGQEWSARSADDTAVIPKDAIVTIRAISGVKLIVVQKTQQKETDTEKRETAEE